MNDQNVCISLITDFGFDSPFVGVMKAVIISRSPATRIIDLFHNVAAYNVDEGGFWLACARMIESGLPVKGGRPVSIS